MANVFIIDICKCVHTKYNLLLAAKAVGTENQYI